MQPRCSLRTRCAAGARREGRGAPAPPSRPPATPPPPATTALPELREGPRLALPQLLRYERKGHVATRGVLAAAELSAFVAPLSDALAAHRLDAFRHRVAVLCPPAAARGARLDSVDAARRMLKTHGHDDAGFLQARPRDSACVAAAGSLALPLLALPTPAHVHARACARVHAAAER